MNKLNPRSKKVKKGPKFEKKEALKKQLDKKRNTKNPYYKKPPEFNELALLFPSFEKHVFINKHGMTAIDWKDPAACIELNKALLNKDFGIAYWDIPADALCPTIPSRIDYLNWINDLLDELFEEKQQPVRGLDIGTGTSLIYPLLGLKLYGWNFVGTDIDDEALNNSRKIIEENKLGDQISVRKSSGTIFNGIIQKDEKFTFTMCNPPYFAHSDEKEYLSNKVNSFLKDFKSIMWKNSQMKENEMVTEGGEVEFLKKMVDESIQVKSQVFLFTSLVGRKKTIPQIKRYVEEKIALLKNETIEFYKIEFAQGTTIRWFIAWKFVQTPKIKAD